MTTARAFKEIAVGAVLVAVYVVAGKLGLHLAFVHASATAVWAPTGIALAAFLIFGYRIWPAILLGAFIVNDTTAGSFFSSLAIAVGNTSEGLLGAYLVNRFAGGKNAFEHPRNVFRYALLAAGASTMVSATCGVTTLSIAGFADWGRYGAIWLTWWLGDASGALIVGPAAVLWSAGPWVRWSRIRALEGLALLLAIAGIGALVFGGLLPTTSKDYPLEFLFAPVLIWAAFRFGLREAATSVALLSVIAIWGTLHDLGPFARSTPNESLLLLQAYMAVTAVTTMALAAVVSQRNRTAEQLVRLATTDALTGVANYRHFIDTLDREIERSARSGRPVAVLLLDLDGLKRINDRHGHVVGSRALCRVAHAISQSCRAIDTAARLGGDEFAVILPDGDRAAAGSLGERIVQCLQADRERPALSVSVGVAVGPDSALASEALISIADRALYEAKAHRGKGATRHSA